MDVRKGGRGRQFNWKCNCKKGSTNPFIVLEVDWLFVDVLSCGMEAPLCAPAGVNHETLGKGAPAS